MSASADAAAASAPGSNLGIAIRRGLTDGAGVVAILYVILFALYALWDRSALTVSGVTNLSNNAAPLAIAAAGESLVVISKGFDLSVSGVVSLSNVLDGDLSGRGPRRGSRQPSDLPWRRRRDRRSSTESSSRSCACNRSPRPSAP